MRAEPVVDARRIIVYGATGSGKSTAAALIAARLGLPAVDVDVQRQLREPRERARP